LLWDGLGENITSSSSGSQKAARAEERRYAQEGEIKKWVGILSAVIANEVENHGHPILLT